MARFNKEEIDRYFDYGIFVKERILWLGSTDTEDGEETGTNYEMCENFIKGITFLARMSEDQITIQMNNIGGDWNHGMAIYDVIRACRSHITIIAYGYACSMGSVILQAGDERILAPDCDVMIHDGKDGFEGDAKSFENWAEHSKVIRKRMYEIYLQRIKEKHPNGKWGLKKIEELCSHDKILTAQEAVDLGLADSIFELIEFDNKPRGNNGL